MSDIVDDHLPDEWRAIATFVHGLMREAAHASLVRDLVARRVRFVPALTRHTPADAAQGHDSFSLATWAVGAGAPNSVLVPAAFMSVDEAPVAVLLHDDIIRCELAQVSAAFIQNVLLRWRALALRAAVSPPRHWPHASRLYNAIVRLSRVVAEIPWASDLWAGDLERAAAMHLQGDLRFLPFRGDLFTPAEVISSDRFGPFWPHISGDEQRWWKHAFVLSDEPDPCDLQTAGRLLRRWIGHRIPTCDVEKLKELLRHFRGAFAPPLGRGAVPLPLPDHGLVMRPSDQLYYFYDTQLPKAVTTAVESRYLHPMLCPRRFDLPLAQLGVRSIREALQKGVSWVEDTSCADVAVLLQSRLRHANFTTLLRLVTEGAARSNLAGISVKLASQLRVRWASDDNEVNVEVDAPRAICVVAPGITTIAVCTRSAGGADLDDEDIRAAIVACVCELLGLPAATRESLLVRGLKLQSDELPRLIHEMFPETAKDGAAGTAGGGAPEGAAAPTAHSPRKVIRVERADGDNRFVGRQSHSEQPPAVPHSMPPVAPPVLRPVDLNAPLTMGGPLRSYYDSGVGLRRSRADVVAMRDPEPAASASARLVLQLAHTARPNCLPIYVRRGAQLPDLAASRHDLKAAARELSAVIRRAASFIEPASLSYCAIYWDPTVSTVFAFNLRGSMYFSLANYVRMRDPFQWMTIFAHEYAHNAHKAHDNAFINALQATCARMIAQAAAGQQPPSAATPPPAGAAQSTTYNL